MKYFEKKQIEITRVILYAFTLNCLMACSTITDEYNEHGYVDLGLPSGLLWATCNVGAQSPEEYGDYFAWGENHTLTDDSECITMRKEIGDISGDALYDVARSEWGGNWRMPRKEDFEELMDYNKCTIERITQNGHNGFLITSKSNGNSIFLPAGGFMFFGVMNNEGNYGTYWSSTPYSEGNEYSWLMRFGESYMITDVDKRHYVCRSFRTPVFDGVGFLSHKALLK